MQIGVSSTLTVYYDGQFWVGMFERADARGLAACRVVFGAEPSNQEVLELVCRRWNRLRFSAPVAGADAPQPAGNPKRRQREAARELAQRGPSTKAQQAVSQEREAQAAQRKADARERRDEAKQQRFELRQAKRKQKHRGK